jgi:methylated-DNA-[protein]-cysteine S-methyltransferase
MFERHILPVKNIGDVLLVTRAGKIAAVDFPDHAARLAKLLMRRFTMDHASLPETTAPDDIEKAFDDWANGSDAAFRALALEEGGTDFQRTVWAALRVIPLGQTWSYARLASAVGNPKAVRAVASANGQNPIGIITPCHRVIGSDGSLTGYAGGLDRKALLLRLEGALPALMV